MQSLKYSKQSLQNIPFKKCTIDYSTRLSSTFHKKGHKEEEQYIRKKEKEALNKQKVVEKPSLEVPVKDKNSKSTDTFCIIS
jgi:hypothetical protein